MCRILVVDEEPVVRELVSEVLSQRGHEPVCASSEEEALAQLDRQEVDLVLMDLPLSRADAQDLLAHIRSERHLRHVPVLVLDGGEDDGTVRKVATNLACAVTRVDRTRFRLEDLLTRVEQAIGLARSGQDDRRKSYRVRTSGHDLSVHLDGIGPWQVVDVSGEGLGVVAHARFEVGEIATVLLREGDRLLEGRMRICYRLCRGEDAFRYGLRIVGRSGSLGRGLCELSMRLQREYLRVRSARS